MKQVALKYSDGSTSTPVDAHWELNEKGQLVIDPVTLTGSGLAFWIVMLEDGRIVGELSLSAVCNPGYMTAGETLSIT
jgi:hypothetical protein